MKVDPEASMRCIGVTIELGGREFEIPALPAADWWPLILRGTPLDFLDIIESSSGLDAMILDGRIEHREITRVFTEVVELVTGRSMHTAHCLVSLGDQNWDKIGGRIARSGFRWDVQPIGAALDLVYATFLDIMLPPMAGEEERKRAEKFIALISDENLSKPAKERHASDDVVKEFEAMAGPRPAPSPVPGTTNAAPSSDQPPRSPRRSRPRHQGARSVEPTPRP